MDFKDRLNGLMLPKSITEIPKLDEELENRKKFVNEVILPPIQAVQKLCEKSENALYLRFPYGYYPISLRNFPEGVLFAWGKIIIRDIEHWRYCLIVTINFTKKWITVQPGDSDPISMMLPDTEIKSKYEDALILAVQTIPSLPYTNTIGKLDWQRFSDKII